MPDASNNRRLAVAAEDLLHGGAYLADRGVGPDGRDDRVHRVLFAAARIFELFQASLDEVAVAPRFQVLEPLQLPLGDLGVYAVGLDVLLFLGLVDRDVDHVAPLLLELALVAGRSLGDLAHREARLYGLDHAPHLVDLAEVLVSLALQLVGEGLDEVRPAKRVYGVRHP